MNENAPREDGPALQRLFAKVDGPAVQHLPPETAFEGAIRAPETQDILTECPNCGAKDGVHLEDCELPVDVGPINYAMHLHEAGEAAVQIVKNLCESEFAQGNPRNIPEPILGWYCMTMLYQLCVLEATLARYDLRKAHAEQLQAARDAFNKYTGGYADGVREELAEVLTTRFRPKGLAEEHLDYRGVLKL